MLHPLKSEWKVENWVRLFQREGTGGGKISCIIHELTHTCMHTHSLECVSQTMT